jgi:hypothetical protein
MHDAITGTVGVVSLGEVRPDALFGTGRTAETARVPEVANLKSDCFLGYTWKRFQINLRRSALVMRPRHRTTCLKWSMDAISGAVGGILLGEVRTGALSGCHDDRRKPLGLAELPRRESPQKPAANLISDCFFIGI